MIPNGHLQRGFRRGMLGSVCFILLEAVGENDISTHRGPSFPTFSENPNRHPHKNMYIILVDRQTDRGRSPRVGRAVEWISWWYLSAYRNGLMCGRRLTRCQSNNANTAAVTRRNARDTTSQRGIIGSRNENKMVISCNPADSTTSSTAWAARTICTTTSPATAGNM